jgi:hypothetical protein
MKHAASRTLFAHWDAVRGERASPERNQIDPGAIRHILADTFILEAGVNDTAVFRLAGTRLCALFRRELRGHPFEKLWPARGTPEARRSIDIVMNEAAGLVSGLVGATPEGATINLEMILLPLRLCGRTRALALGTLSPGMTPAWLGFHPVTHLDIVSQRVIQTSRLRVGVRLPQRPSQFVVHHGGRA